MAVKKPPFAPKELRRGKDDKWMSAGWVLLLLGGLAHMLPTQMEPLLKWSMWGISLQMVIGVLSVVIALYYLLDE